MSVWHFEELPPWAQDRLTTEVMLKLDWRGRLRCLIQGECHVRVNVTTEYKPGRCESESGLRFPHWCWPWHRHLEMACVAPEEQAG